MAESSATTDDIEKIGKFIHNLPQISPTSKNLTGSNIEFDKKLLRWSRIYRNKQIPYVIVSPKTEDDVLNLVQAAIKAKIPFVPSTGGHSFWSTVKEGMVIDLSQFKETFASAKQRTVTVRGGALMTDLVGALSLYGQFTTVANGRAIGVIPYFIGGGISSYTALTGYACENILSARIILANGTLVTASETENQYLLWAIRGAGQFFGIVTELVIRTYPLKLIGPWGIHTVGVIFFPVERAAGVCRVLNEIIAANNHVSSGYLTVLKDQSESGRSLMVAPQYIGTESQLRKTFKPLLDLGPVYQDYEPSIFEFHWERFEWMYRKGDYKRFSQIGLLDLNPENFARLVDLHGELLDTVRDAERSMFTIEWHTPTPQKGPREMETCFGLKGINFWLNILTWYSSSRLHDQVLSFDQRARAIMREGTPPETYITYTNTNRDDPIEWRYRDPAALEKLRVLKRRYDPDGVFTKELL